jgi:formylglycine-generating enzyme required for sulfatase activity
MTVRNQLLLNGKRGTAHFRAAGFCFCALVLAGCTAQGPIVGNPGSGSIMRLQFEDTLRTIDLRDIDSIRLTFSSLQIAGSQVYTFPFKTGRATANLLLPNISYNMKMECLLETGVQVAHGLFAVTPTDQDSNVVFIKGADLTPRAPSDFSYEIFNGAEVRLSWRNNSHFVDSFTVERTAGDNDGFAVIGTSAQPVFHDCAPVLNMPCHYRIYAKNAAGASDTLNSPPVNVYEAPLLRVLSHTNPDTVTSDAVTIYGTAKSGYGIALFSVNDSLIPIKNGSWSVTAYKLKAGANRILFKTVDSSAAANASVVELTLAYNPSYVPAVNHPPFFKVHPSNLSEAIVAGHKYSKVLQAWDVDLNNVFAITVTAPLIMRDDSMVVWVPALSDTGIHRLRADVTDQDGAQDSLLWTVMVVNPNVSAPPVFITQKDDLADSIEVNAAYVDTIICRSVNQQARLNYRVIFDDSSVQLADSLTGIFRWVPSDKDIGAHLATATVIDDSGLTSTMSWVVTVYDTMPPLALAGNDTAVSINDAVNLHGRAIKDKGPVVSFEWDIGNTGHFIKTSSGDTAIIAPSIPDSSYVCVLRVTDYAGNQAEDRMTVTVVLDPPVIFMQGGKVVRINEPFELYAEAFDEYGVIVSKEWNVGAARTWTACDSGLYAGIAPASPGQYLCSFRAVDDDGNCATGSVMLWVTGSKMRYIGPSGADGYIRFSMGFATGAPDEKPLHSVAISPFYIDSTEVTQENYEYIMQTNPSSFISPRKPVGNITWFDAILYCNARSKQDGFDTVYSYAGIQGVLGKSCTGLANLNTNYSVTGYRLPTEAEWEYAAKGTVITRYQWGNDTAGATKYAWYVRNSSLQSHDVKALRPNEFGLFDLFGNVGEWCNDWYSADYYPECAQMPGDANPIGPVSGINRVIRGGSWRDAVTDLPISRRSYGIPSWSSSFVGVRCVLSAKGPF